MLRLLPIFFASCLFAQEAAVLQSIDAGAAGAIASLETLVNQNSGTFHLEGVRKTGLMIEPQLRALGFETKFLSMDSVKRAPHLLAEHKGTHPAKPLLLIGHMDTVFELSSPFQRFVRDGGRATGPGTSDMKGGLIVMLSALQALDKAGLLKDANITVLITADEEAPGEPISVTRGPLIEQGKKASAALCFETGVRVGDQDYASTARRGFTGWELRVKGNEGHSGQIFTPKFGDGAIFEISRILSQFHDQLREPNMTFNAGLIAGGSTAEIDRNGSGGIRGKDNIIAAEAIARGEIRALSPEQVARVKDKMQGIVARTLPGTKSEITFAEGYPPMAPTPGNKRLLAALNEASSAAGLPKVGELDPMQRGAGDISFIAPFVDSISGLGAIGTGAHAPGEAVDLTSLARQTKRAALLILRLTR